MRKFHVLPWFLALVALLPLTSGGQTNTVNVSYTFSDFTTHPLNVSRVTLTPLAAGADYMGAQLSSMPMVYSAAAYPTLTNGALVISNVICGYAYRVQFSDGYGTPTITNYFLSTLTNAPAGYVLGNSWKTPILVYQNGQVSGYALASLSGYEFATNYLTITNTVNVTNVFSVTNNISGGSNLTVTGASTGPPAITGYAISIPTNYDAPGAAIAQGAANTNFTLQTGTALTNDITSASNAAVTAGGARGTNAALAQGAANTNDAAARVAAALGTVTNLVAAQGTANTNDAAARVAAALGTVTNLVAAQGTANTNFTLQTGTALTNDIVVASNAAVVAGGARGTNAALAQGAANTNDAAARVSAALATVTNLITSAVGPGVMNLVVAQGAANTNDAAAQVKAALVVVTNLVNSQVTSESVTNLVVAQGTANTNFTLQTGTALTNDIVAASNAAVVAGAARGTNAALAQGALNTNFTLQTGTALTNDIVAASNAAVVAGAARGTNAALAQGAANTNDAAARVTAAVATSTAYASTNPVDGGRLSGVISATLSGDGSGLTNLQGDNIVWPVPAALTAIKSQGEANTNDAAARIVTALGTVTNMVTAQGALNTNFTLQTGTALTNDIVAASNAAVVAGGACGTNAALAQGAANTNDAAARIVTALGTVTNLVTAQGAADTSEAILLANAVSNNTAAGFLGKTNGTVTGLMVISNLNLSTFYRTFVITNSIIGVGGNNPAQGTYIQSGASAWTNCNNAAWDLIYSAPNYYLRSNGVPEFEKSQVATNTAWNSINGMTPPGATWVGDIFNADGTLIIGSLNSTNITAQINASLNGAFLISMTNAWTTIQSRNTNDLRFISGLSNTIAPDGSANLVDNYWSLSENSAILSGVGNFLALSAYPDANDGRGGVIVGGDSNTNESTGFGFIGTGWKNALLSAPYETVLNGIANTVAHGSYGTILNGPSNYIGYLSFDCLTMGVLNYTAAHSENVFAFGESNYVCNIPFQLARTWACAIGNYNVLNPVFNGYGSYGSMAIGESNMITGMHDFLIGDANTAVGTNIFILGYGGSSSTANTLILSASAGVGINTNNPNGNALEVCGNVDASSMSIGGVNITNLIVSPTNGITAGAVTNIVDSLLSSSTNLNSAHITGYSFNAITNGQTNVWLDFSSAVKFDVIGLSTNTNVVFISFTNLVLAANESPVCRVTVRNTETNELNLSWPAGIVWTGNTPNTNGLPPTNLLGGLLCNVSMDISPLNGTNQALFVASVRYGVPEIAAVVLNPYAITVVPEDADNTGVLWESPTAPKSIVRVRYLNGKFFAFDSSPVYYTSTNGLANWVTNYATPLADDAIVDMAQGSNGVYVAVGLQGRIYSNPNPATSNWTSRVSTNITDDFKAIVYGNNRFVAVGSHRTATSTDGTNWTHKYDVNGITNTLYDVAYGPCLGGIWEAVGDDNGITYYTQDGSTWGYAHAYILGQFAIAYAPYCESFVGVGQFSIPGGTANGYWFSYYNCGVPGSAQGYGTYRSAATTVFSSIAVLGQNVIYGSGIDGTIYQGTLSSTSAYAVPALIRTVSGSGRVIASATAGATNIIVSTRSP